MVSATKPVASAGPLWQRVSTELRDRIESGRYESVFPGEWELAEEFGVSRGTIRAALRPLREAGLVTSARGRRPSIVHTEQASQYGAIYSLRDLITQSGATHHSRVLGQEITRNGDAAVRLGVEPDVDLFRLERIRYAGDEPIAHDVLYAPAALAGDLLHVDFSEVAFYGQLRERCGITVQGGSEHIEARIATAVDADRLQCAVGDAVLQVERVACAEETIVEYRQTCFRGDRFRTARTFGTPFAPCGPAVLA